MYSTKADGEIEAEVKAEPKDTADTKVESPENQKKRPREDDGGADETPAKKVDTKTEVAAEAS